MMPRIRLTHGQQSFVEVELIGRHELSSDPEVLRIVEIMRDAYQEERQLAVPVPGWLYGALLDVHNTIDDAAQSGSTEVAGFGTPAKARGLQRTAASLMNALSLVPGWWGFKK